MEEDKKKKKNKKKKGKQTKTSDVAVTDGETASVEQNHNKQISGTAANIQTSGVLESDVKLDRHQNNGVENKCLEEEIKQVQLDKHSWILKEASLEEKIRELLIEMDSCMQREASLIEKIEQLQIEKANCIQMEDGLEKKIMQLQNEKDSWLQKEAALEDKLKLLESDKESWALKENSAKEMLTRLDVDKMGLQTKVKELEESKNHLLQENQRLIETVSVLQSQIQNLAKDTSSSSATSTAETHVSQDRDANAQMEAANALVEKLVRENAELVEKVNELYIELDKRSVTAGHSSNLTQDLAVVIPETATVTDYVSEITEQLPESNEILGSSLSNENEDKKMAVDHADMESIAVNEGQTKESPGLYEVGEIEEIVQVPLDDNEIREVESQATETDEKVGVPLTDAPLIGAPFRLISFVAKYVSGADLVNKNTSSSGR
ncbi:hypothetical protein BVC80_1767g10 [Macleaya cordata]|uniref:Uncharacterized protein n=1 Tax=Macleaya cordata TaxID=56857 RepID=A0A200QTA7_MACCD|nr:hypothetical protein BVC80_1767g10 [Macleaya cordata]